MVVLHRVDYCVRCGEKQKPVHRRKPCIHCGGIGFVNSLVDVHWWLLIRTPIDRKFLKDLRISVDEPTPSSK